MKCIEVPCREIVEWVTDFFEGAPTAERQRLFVEHLADCPPCHLYVDQIKRTKEALGEVSDDDLSPEARSALRHAFRGLSENGTP